MDGNFRAQPADVDLCDQAPQDLSAGTPGDIVLLEARPLARRLEQALRDSCSFTEETASETVEHLVAAERAGKNCHGLIRLKPLLDGTFKFDSHRIPQGRASSSCSLAFDGAGLPGYVVAAAMMQEAIRVARRHGMCLALGRHVYPSGYLGYYGRKAAEAGFIAHIEATSPSRVTSPGHRKPYVGTNPICRSYPVAGQTPAVIDLATSAITHGDLLVAQAAGTDLPPHAAVRADGSPAVRVEDFDAAKDDGALLPFGGRQAYKSFALALSVGLQCSFSGAPPAAANGSDFGLSMLIIDASAIDPMGDERRATWLSGLAEENGVRIPGWESIGTAKAWESRGEVPLAVSTWELLQRYI